MSPPELGMSESAFSKYFKRMSGQTFSDTVRKLRLAQAGKLLKDTDLAVGSIYHRAGYPNLSNFNRQFQPSTASPRASSADYTKTRELVLAGSNPAQRER